MKKLIVTSVLVALFTTTVPAFAGSAVGSNDYGVNEARQSAKVEQGVIVDMRAVQLHEAPRQTQPMGGYGNAGTALGGLLGGVVGNSVGGGNFALSGIAAAAGAVLGNTVYNGVSAEEQQQDGSEFIVQLDSGSMIAVTQGNQGVDFMVGDRVNVVSSSTGIRLWAARKQAIATK